MPAREPVLGADSCTLARRWTVREDVLILVQRAARLYENDGLGKVYIISGYRTPGDQLELKRKGRPVADPSVSTHLSCPATGVDISLGWPTHNAQKLAWVTFARAVGLRAGGGSPEEIVEIDGRQFRLPTDWNHVDVGPRDPGT